MFPKGLGNLPGLLKQAMEVKSKMESMKESLAGETVESSAGGGMVTVVMSGAFELVSLKIDPEIVTKDDTEMLETLVLAAVNEGVRKVQDLVQSRMAEITGGLGLPGLF